MHAVSQINTEIIFKTCGSAFFGILVSQNHVSLIRISANNLKGTALQYKALGLELFNLGCT